MRPKDPYAPHLAFVRPAFARAEIWRIVCVAIGFEVCFFLTPLFVEAMAPSQAAVTAFREGTTPVATLMQFLAFAVTAAGLLVLVRVFHQRGLGSLIGPADDARRHLMRVFWAVAIVLAVQEPAILWLERDLIGEMRDIGQWALWLLPALVALLIQVGCEELFFRGYLQQQLAARSASRRVWMLIPSLMFGLAHYANGIDAVEGILWAFWATLLGLACADLTARTGNLGAAVGLHLANNAFALLVIATEGYPASGLALFLYPYEAPATFSLPVTALFEPWGFLQFILAALSVFVMWMAARLTLRR